MRTRIDVLGQGKGLTDSDLAAALRALADQLEQLTPIPEDDLERAADLLENFAEHWDAAEGDAERQHELVKLIVERVYVDGEEVMA